ncbi:MAG TPA: SDR family NAD(P)-dependent oxidoreductase [Pyrinomonadaceae bacterium]
MSSLKDKVALVTGASRGVGKGIALGLGEAGALVYLTGRTLTEADAVEGLPGTIQQTADEISSLGGRAFPVLCDHSNDEAVEALFQRIREEHGRLDLLVNNVWGGYEHMVQEDRFIGTLPFWEQPLWRWDTMFRAGVRAHYVASAKAAPMMIERKSGLIVNISYWAAQKFMSSTMYGVAKAATDKMTADMSQELRSHEVAVVSLYPGLVRTERVMRAAAFFDLSNSESPLFIGRAVSALAADPHIMRKSGQILIAAALAREYGFTDIDGRQPQPLSLDSA